MRFDDMTVSEQRKRLREGIEELRRTPTAGAWEWEDQQRRLRMLEEDLQTWTGGRRRERLGPAGQAGHGATRIGSAKAGRQRGRRQATQRDAARRASSLNPPPQMAQLAQG